MAKTYKMMFQWRMSFWTNQKPEYNIDFALVHLRFFAFHLQFSLSYRTWVEVEFRYRFIQQSIRKEIIQITNYFLHTSNCILFMPFQLISGKLLVLANVTLSLLHQPWRTVNIENGFGMGGRTPLESRWRAMICCSPAMYFVIWAVVCGNLHERPVYLHPW